MAAFASTYRDWARAALRERGGELLEGVRAREQGAQALHSAQAAVCAARERRAELELRREQLEQHLAEARGAERELRASEDWRAAERLEELRLLAERTQATASAAAAELERAAREESELGEAAERAAYALGEQEAAVHSLLNACSEQAALAGVERHGAAVAGLVEEQRALDAIRGLLEQFAGARSEAIAATASLARALTAAEQSFAAARDRFEDAEARQRERQAERAQAAQWLEEIQAALLEGLEGWAAALEQLPVDDPLAGQLAERLARAGAPGAPGAHELVRERAGAAEQRLREELAGVGTARTGLVAEREPLAGEHARLSAHEDPVPERLPFRTAERAGRPGAPLWALVDFAAELDEYQRAGLEGALEGAGLLDAWVMPDGTLLDADDAVLVPAASQEPAAGSNERAAGDRTSPHPLPRTLAGALLPLTDGPVAAEIIAGVLTRIVLGAADGDARDYDAPGGEGAAVGFDGRFALGPLRGRHRVDVARYIGAAARAANRARRLAELDARCSPSSTARDRALDAHAWGRAQCSTGSRRSCGDCRRTPTRPCPRAAATCAGRGGACRRAYGLRATGDGTRRHRSGSAVARSRP